MNCSVFFRRSTWIAFALACAPSARAELLVGDAGDQTPAAVLTYADSAAGAATPLGSFSTAAGNGIAPLQDPSSLTFDPLENVVYVADFYGQAIRVYRPGAVGNVAPLRTLNPSLLGQPRQVALSTLHDELIIATGCCVITYGRYTYGTQAVPSRYLPPSYTPEGSSTRLNNPGGIVLRTSSDEIIIPDTGNGPNNTYFGVVLFFPRSLTGNSSRHLSRARSALSTLLRGEVAATRASSRRLERRVCGPLLPFFGQDVGVSTKISVQAVARRWLIRSCRETGRRTRRSVLRASKSSPHSG
jgi:hypothetical protein